MDWNELLGWSEEELEDLRFVGFSYANQGLYDLAIKFFKALTVLSPNSVYDLQMLGALYLETGKNLEALEIFDQALDKDPEHYPTLLNRAKVLYLLGHRKQAISQIESLQHCVDPEIASQATALKLIYR